MTLWIYDYIAIAKENNKKFAPGIPGKAHYSDLYFVGGVNQFAKQGEIFILPLKLAKLANKYIG